MSIFDFAYGHRTFIREMRSSDIQLCKILDDSPSAKDYAAFQQYVRVGYPCGANVVVSSARIVAWCCYGYLPNAFIVHRVVVAPMTRRKGHGRMLLDWFSDQFSHGPQKCVRASVAEHDLVTQQWLRACGFFCVATEKSRDGDIYVFEKGRVYGANRVRKFLEATR